MAFRIFFLFFFMIFFSVPLFSFLFTRSLPVKRLFFCILFFRINTFFTRHCYVIFFTLLLFDFPFFSILLISSTHVRWDALHFTFRTIKHFPPLRKLAIKPEELQCVLSFAIFGKDERDFMFPAFPAAEKKRLSDGALCARDFRPSVFGLMIFSLMFDTSE